MTLEIIGCLFYSLKTNCLSICLLCRKFGYYTVFGSSCVMMLIGLIFCVVCVHEVESPTEGSGQSHKPKPSTALLCLDYFNLKDFRTIIKVIYRKRSHNKRIMLWVGYSIIIFGLGPNLGESFMILTINSRIHWFSPFRPLQCPVPLLEAYIQLHRTRIQPIWNDHVD